MRLSYTAEGDGAPVVLLHGFPEDRTSWLHQVPFLAARGWRAIAPDLRGYGTSPKPRGVDSYRTPVLIADVIELLEDLGTSRAMLVGHDWGGFIAWFVAMQRPDLLQKLVILNVPHPALYAEELRRSTRQKLRSFYQLCFQIPLLPEMAFRVLGSWVVRRMGTFSEVQIDHYAAMWRDSLGPMFHYYRGLRRSRRELRNMIRPIYVPTMMIWGENEPVFLQRTNERTGEWVRDFRFELIRGAGHFVQHDAPERVNELLSGFLTQ